jgi:chromosome segregation ATPase
LDAEKAAKEKAEREAAKKRFDEYWKAHAKEKEDLESERNELQKKIASLEEEIKLVPGGDEKQSYQKNIAEFEKEKKELGIFKIKEKKALQEKIDAEKSKLAAVIKRMNDAINAIKATINPLQKRIESINLELTKAR